MRIALYWLALAAGACLIAGPVAAQYSLNHHILIVTQTRAGGSYLGVGLSDIDSNRAKAIHLGDARGAEVMRVQEGSPAEDAGIRTGDVLLSYNGESVVGAQQLGRLVAETPVGRKVKLEYWRAGKPATTVVTTGNVQLTDVGVPASSVSGADQDLSDLRSFAVVDIPNPLLIWRNAVLGIVYESLDPQLAQYFAVKQGVLVRSVEENSPAGKSGVRAGDVITGIGDRAVLNTRDVSSCLRMERHRAPKTISMELTRERKPMVLKISFPEGLE